MNPLFKTDAYKLGHHLQYPPKTTMVYSNWTPRGCRLNGFNPDRHGVVFFGLQAWLSKFKTEMDQQFFLRDKSEVLDEYRQGLIRILGPGEHSVEHIGKLHDLGYIPLEFHALQEGTVSPLRIPQFVVFNTHPDFYWLTNYIETWLSSELWQPITSATIALLYRLTLETYAKVTAPESLEFVKWQGHDFSCRGMSSMESAASSAAGHLTSFYGTDTLAAMDWIDKYYGNSGPMGSVPATEHAVMCAGGAESELETFSRLLDTYPTGVLSIVSDTWNLWDVLTVILPKLKDKIMARNGKLVIRPDSGDPADILCGLNTKIGYERRQPILSNDVAEYLGVVETLWNLFGGTTNERGYKVLDSHIGTIYGDSITLERAKVISSRLEDKNFASTNCVYGIGSYTYQYNTRDTLGFAIKATYVEIDGQGMPIYKNPVTDSGLKKSARGKIAVVPDGKSMQLLENADNNAIELSLLRPIWKNGLFLRKTDFTEIRNRIDRYVESF